MNAKALVKAICAYETKKRLLEPERYVSLDVFRQGLSDLFPPAMMPPPMPGDDAPGGPMGGGPADSSKLEKALAAILRGETVEDSVMTGFFGFGNGELTRCLKEADPVIAPIPDKQILLTFDDSTLDHYTVACPILEKYGFHANLFTTEMESGMFGAPGFSDKSRYMTWEQIKELSDRGHEIVNHSWHHLMNFCNESDENIRREITVIEERCERYSIPKPRVFGAPGGGYTPRLEKILHDMGYLWGRGDMNGVSPRRVGDALYDPYVDTPIVLPNCNPATAERLKEVLEAAVGKVPLLVFHGIDDPMMPGIPFETLVRTIYECGGKAITFGELSRYVDPVKAYDYTH